MMAKRRVGIIDVSEKIFGAMYSYQTIRLPEGVHISAFREEVDRDAVVVRLEGKGLPESYEVVEGNGLVAFGRDLVSLDATFFSLLGFGLNHFRGYINRAEEEFGVYDRGAIKEAKMSVGDWLIQ